MNSTAIIFQIVCIAIVGAIVYFSIRANKRRSKEECLRSVYSPRQLLLLMEIKRQAEEVGDTDTVKKVLNLKYDGQFPMERPDGSYTRYDSKLWTFDIAGINYQKGIKKYVGKFDGYIQPEPDNLYDPNAIAIYHRDGHQLGYIKATHTATARQFIQSQFPYPCLGYIDESYDDDCEHRTRFFFGKIILEIPNSTPNVSPSNS